MFWPGSMQSNSLISTGSIDRCEAVAKEPVVDRALLKVGTFGGQQSVTQLVDASREVLGVGRFGPEVGHDVLELALLFEVAQNHVDLADDKLKHVELGFQKVKHGGLDRARGDQVENVNVMSLADAAEPADPLLDLHRVPGQVEIAYSMGELEVAALAAGLCAKQQPRLITESLDGRFLLQPRQSPVKDRDVVARLRQPRASSSWVARNCVKITILSRYSFTSPINRWALVFSP